MKRFAPFTGLPSFGSALVINASAPGFVPCDAPRNIAVAPSVYNYPIVAAVLDGRLSPGALSSCAYSMRRRTACFGLWRRHDMADGWLFKLVSEGLEPGTRPMTNWWASWLSDENKALACIQDHVGECKAAGSKPLSEQQLRLMGLRRPGDEKKVRTEF
jgi:hypothetical protein